MKKIARLLALYIPLIIFVLFVLVFFGRLFYPHLSVFVTPDFGQSDLLYGYYPIKFALSQSLSHFTIPLWTQFENNGYPLFADGQIGALSLQNIILFKFFPFFWAINLQYVSSFLVAGLGCYLLGRVHKLSIATASLSAITFSLSGFMIMQITHISLVQSAAYIPLMVYLTEKLLQRRSAQSVLLFILVLSQQIFTGHQQITAYTLFIVGLYIFLRVVSEKKGTRLGLFLVVYVLIFIMVSAALVLSAAILLPSIELFKNSLSQEGVSATASFPYPPVHLLAFLNPFHFGSPKNGSYPLFNTDWGIFWENTGYIGLLPIVALLIGVIFYLKDKKVRTYILLIAIGILLVLGKYSPLYFIFDFPPLSLFRVPSRFLVLVDFSLAMLTGIIAQKILEKFIRSKKMQSIFVITLMIFQGATIFFYFFLYHPVATVSSWYKKPKMVTAIESLLKPGERLYAFDDSIRWNEVFLKEGWKNPQKYQVFRNNIAGHENLFYNIPKSNPYVKFLSKRTSLYNEYIQFGLNKGSVENTIQISTQSASLLGLSSVKYLISPIKIESPSVSLRDTMSGYYLYENTRYQPRAFVAHRYFTATTVDDMAQWAMEGSENLLIEKQIVPDVSCREQNNSHDTVSIKTDESERVDIHVTTPCRGVLVLSDTYYPGWRAYIDGKETQIFPVNIDKRGVEIEPGKHIVRFSYEPQSFYFGFAISAVSYILVMIGLLISPVRSFFYSLISKSQGQFG